MTDFVSFASLGAAFQQGFKAVAEEKNPGQVFRGRGRFTPHVKTALDFEQALKDTGEKLVEHFQNKFDNGGPGWPGLEDSTVELRDHRGYGGDDPLDETGALRAAICFEVDPLRGELQVGVKGEHTGAGDNRGTISMEDLMSRHESGYVNSSNGMFPGKFIPPRRVFSDNDWPAVEDEAVRNFAEYALFGHKTGLVRWRTSV